MWHLEDAVVTKGEILAALEPFPDDEEIGCGHTDGSQVQILGVFCPSQEDCANDPDLFRVVILPDL